MSSSKYVAELHPDALLRRLVLLSGASLAALGAALIFTLPLHRAVLFGASVGWLLLCAREVVNASRGFSHCVRLRISAGGEILMLDPDGVWQRARLLSGSVVLRRVGWILFEANDGRRFAELLRGRCRENDEWRRLQVIWRHIGGTQ
jgi:hypothetical protein